MNAGEIHILRAWGHAAPLRSATDTAVLACVERVLQNANPTDRVLLVADEHGERRAAALGLRTPFVLPPSALHRSPIRSGLRRGLARWREAPSRLVTWEAAMFAPVREASDSLWGTPVAVRDGRVDAAPFRVPAGNREGLRESLALPATECVLLLLADPPDALSAHDFVRAGALVGLAGRDVTVIVPRQAPEMDRAKATLRNTGIPLKLMTVEAPVWTLLPAADAVVVDLIEGSAPRLAPFHSRQRMAFTCAKMGIPVVWPDAEWSGNPSLDRWIFRPRSRLAVHVARAINEHFIDPAGIRLAAAENSA